MSQKTLADKELPNYPWTARQKRDVKGSRKSRKGIRVHPPKPKKEPRVKKAAVVAATGPKKK